MKGSAAVFSFVYGLLASAAWSQTPVSIGGEFQVNTYTTSYQSGASLTVDSDGDFVVVWKSEGSYGTDTSYSSIQGQRYDAEGNALGAEFQVNTYTTSAQGGPEVSIDADGGLIVVWTSLGSAGTDTSEWSVQARRYDAAGSALGEEFQINTYTTGWQWNPSVAAKSDGSFVMVWNSNGSWETDTNGHSIQARRFDMTGAPIGTEFQVNTYTTYSQSSPSIAMGTNGDFVVVWQSSGSSGSDTSGPSIQGQRFDAVATPIGEDFQVNTYTTGYQAYPDVAATTDDGFVVVWSSYGSYGDYGYGVLGQRYDETGSAIGGEFQVNTYTTGSQGYFGSHSVAALPGGGFVVIWSSEGSYGTDDSSFSVQGQRFAADSVPVGTQFQVNTYTPRDQGYYSVAVASDSSGDFVVAWPSYGSSGTDTDFTSIQGQRFFVAGIFTDGFEFGGTSAWSDTVGLVPGGPITFISLQVTPGSVSRTGGILTLSALVRDNVGQGVTSAPVAFTTEAGTLGSGGAIVLTGSGGLATDSLTLTAADVDGLGASSFDVSASTVDFSGSLIESIFTVGVQSGSPVADFTFSINGLDVSFLNASTGDPVLSYSWNFGDGTMPANRFDANPVHTYTVNDMVYNVTLTVTNSVGTDSIQQPVNVGNPP